MAKPEAASKQKPRMKNVRTLALESVLPIARGQAVYQSTDSTVDGIVADLDAQIINLKLKQGGTFTFPFSKCKYWQPGMGVAKE